MMSWIAGGVFALASEVARDLVYKEVDFRRMELASQTPKSFSNNFQNQTTNLKFHQPSPIYRIIHHV